MLLALTVAIAHAVAVPARASAASGRPPIGLGQTPNSGTAAGMRSAPPTGQALAGTLDQMTGLTPAQVQLQDVCPAVAPGLARCAAQALILQSTHRLVRPDVARTRPLALGPRSAQPAAASAATAPAVSQPAAGTPAYLQQAYDLAYLSQTGGRGDTVAIVDAYDDPNAESDLGTFPHAPPAWRPAPPPTAAFARSTRAAPRRRSRPATRMGGGDLARPRRRLGALPELPHPPRRGHLDDVDRHGHRDADRGQAGRPAGLGQLVGVVERASGRDLHAAGRRRRRCHRRPRLSGRRDRQLSGGLRRGHRRRGHVAQRRQQRPGRSWLRGVRVVAGQRRLGRRLGL